MGLPWAPMGPPWALVGAPLARVAPPWALVEPPLGPCGPTKTIIFVTFGVHKTVIFTLGGALDLPLGGNTSCLDRLGSPIDTSGAPEALPKATQGALCAPKCYIDSTKSA